MEGYCNDLYTFGPELAALALEWRQQQLNGHHFGQRDPIYQTDYASDIRTLQQFHDFEQADLAGRDRLANRWNTK